MLEFGNVAQDPGFLFTVLVVLVPPLKMFFDGTTVDKSLITVLVNHFSDKYFLLAAALFFLWVSWAQNDYRAARPLSHWERVRANWYLWNAFIYHFLMDGLVGCYGKWDLMVVQYRTLDRRFFHDVADVNATAFPNLPHMTSQLSSVMDAAGTNGTLGRPENWSVPFVVGHVEMLLMAPLCLLAYLAWVRHLSIRRPVEIVVAVLHAFGAIVFIASEEVTGSPNIWRGKSFTNLDDITYFWFGYWFANLIWVFVPGYIVFENIRALATDVEDATTVATAKSKSYSLELELARLRVRLAELQRSGDSLSVGEETPDLAAARARSRSPARFKKNA